MLFKDRNGVINIRKIPRRFNRVYSQALVQYLRAIDPLFERARLTSEFDFILSLLNIKGVGHVRLDPFETTRDILATINRLKAKIKYIDEQTYIFLLLYGLVIEASYPYELLANLLNIIGGGRYCIENFPDRLTQRGPKPIAPGEKIQIIRNNSRTLNLEKHVDPLSEVYNRELRNAIFHSDYSLYEDKILIPKTSTTYSIDEINTLINRTLAYWDSIVNLIVYYRSFYRQPKLIAAPSGFSNDHELKAVVMVRKRTGVVGLKDNWTIEQIRNGKIPFQCAVLLPYEQKMLKNNPTLALFPPNKIDKINKVLSLLPVFVRKRLFKLATRMIVSF